MSLKYGFKSNKPTHYLLDYIVVYAYYLYTPLAIKAKELEIVAHQMRPSKGSLHSVQFGL